MLSRLLSAAAISFLVIALLSLPVYCQHSVGRLEGAVLDPSGEGIPDCHILAAREDMKKPVEITGDKGGVFLFATLAPGEYTITVQAPNFRSEVRSGVVVEAGTTSFQRFHLEPGNPGASIATTVRPILTDPQPVMGGRMDSQEMVALPQIERRPTSLAAYVPGVQVEAGDESHSRVNGTREATSNLRIDGLDANDPLTPAFGLSAIPLNADSIASFQVVNGVSSPISGPGTGAHVEMVTRSGANRWSGNAFEYFRNKSFNANNFFNNADDVDQPAFNQHLFGVSLGGAVIPDKSFFFINYQGRKTKQDVIRNRLVLTSEAKTGIFRWYTPNTGNLQSYNIAKNDRRRLGINSQVATLLAKLPEPNNDDIGDDLNTSGYQFNSPVNSYDHQATVRIDHALTKKHQLFYRMNWDKNSSVDWLNGNESRYPGEKGGTDDGRSYSHAVGSDWTFSSQWTNSLRLGVRRSWLDSLRPGRQNSAMLLSNSWTDPLSPAFAKARDNRVIQANDFAATQRGRHYFRSGVEFAWTTLNSSTDEGTWPNVTFARDNGNTPTGNIGPVGTAVISSADRQRFEGLYNDLLGRMDKVTQTFYSDLEEFKDAGTKRERTYNGRAYSAFLQDDWRVRTNLSVVLGLRYELGAMPTERSGLQATLDQASSIDAVSQISNFKIETTKHWYARDVNNFAPRFGFAWNPKNSGRTVLRGGYGLYYEHLSGAVNNTVDAYTTGFSQTVTSYPNTGGKDVRLSDGIPSLSPRSSPDMTPSVTRSESVAVLNPKLRTGYVHQFALTLQRQIRSDTVLEAGYVGTQGNQALHERRSEPAQDRGGFPESLSRVAVVSSDWHAGQLDQHPGQDVRFGQCGH